ncbi:dihydrolipoamide acetyltransferase [Rosistilla oblonga]|uniref:Flagellar protein FliL n=1 Tax=Rosistilla oblonga TaxID=2527990 RepID=A0A518IU27_9BACT|nr:dihydrolipoamide acetyltransferase [Rosistilla oblonga]QDV56582.1 hypothetical protein Mal33_25740 [Rosistilla oblonga]
MADNNENVEGEETPPAAPKSKKLMIAGFVSAVVIVETLLFFFMVPSADEVAAMAESQLIEEVQNESEVEIKKEDDEKKVIEFQLGSFGETFSPLGTERQYAVEFRLFGTLRQKNKEMMTKEFEEKEGRLQHGIRMVVRNSRLEELQDNQLGLIERRILTTCNALLEEPILLSVGFKQYKVREE